MTTTSATAGLTCPTGPLVVDDRVKLSADLADVVGLAGATGKVTGLNPERGWVHVDFNGRRLSVAPSELEHVTPRPALAAVPSLVQLDEREQAANAVLAAAEAWEGTFRLAGDMPGVIARAEASAVLAAAVSRYRAVRGARS